MKLLSVFSFVLCIATMLLLKAQTPPQQLWFQISNGDQTCLYYKVPAIPLEINFYCTSPRGILTGHYSANATNPSRDVFNIGLHNMASATATNAANSIDCMVGVNTTTAAISGIGGSIPPNGGNAQCGRDLLNNFQITFP